MGKKKKKEKRKKKSGAVITELSSSIYSSSFGLINISILSFLTLINIITFICGVGGIILFYFYAFILVYSYFAGSYKKELTNLNDLCIIANLVAKVLFL
jgi:hypothetical protein